MKMTSKQSKQITIKKEPQIAGNNLSKLSQNPFSINSSNLQQNQDQNSKNNAINFSPSLNFGMEEQKSTGQRGVHEEGDSFSSEDEKLIVHSAYDVKTSLLVRKRSYRFLSIIERRNDFCQNANNKFLDSLLRNDINIEISPQKHNIHKDAINAKESYNIMKTTDNTKQPTAINNKNPINIRSKMQSQNLNYPKNQLANPQLKNIVTQQPTDAVMRKGSYDLSNNLKDKQQNDLMNEYQFGKIKNQQDKSNQNGSNRFEQMSEIKMEMGQSRGAFLKSFSGFEHEQKSKKYDDLQKILDGKSINGKEEDNYILNDLKKDLENYNSLINSIDKSLNAKKNHQKNVRNFNNVYYQTNNNNSNSNKQREQFVIDQQQYSDMTHKENYSNIDLTMKSFMDLLKIDQNEKVNNFEKDLNLKQTDQSREEEYGRFLQKLIDNSKRGEQIELPAERIRVHSLYISRPVTLIGRPGCILEIQGGTIHIDFSQESKQANQQNLSQSHNKSKDNQGSVNLKRSEVAMISEVQIIFNRNKAFEEAQNYNNQMKQSTGIINKNNKIILKDANNKFEEVSETDSIQNLKKRNYVGCFLIENDSFLEIRDCYIQSVKDQKQIEKENEEILKNLGDGVPQLDMQDVEDCCFCMNIESVIPLQSKDSKKAEVELSNEFVGVISLQSTTLSDFYYGVVGGYNSIVNLEKSSIINNRGTAVKLIHPRIFKMQASIIQKSDEDGIEITLIQNKNEKTEVTASDPNGLGSSRKLLIQSNRLISIKNHPIIIQQVPIEFYKDQTLLLFGDNSFTKLYQNQNINALIKINNNKIYSVNKDSIFLKGINVKNVEITKNDLLKSSGSAIHLTDVKAQGNDPKRILIKNNFISEISGAPAVQIENSSCVIEQNEIKKNLLDGILLSTNSNLQSISQVQQNPPIVLIIDNLCQENKGSGLVINEYEGFIDIKDSKFNFNEQHGIVVSQFSQVISQASDAMDTSQTQENVLNQIFDKTKVKQIQRRAFLILFNTELWGNKLDGLRVKLMKCHLMNCKIRQNIGGAIYMDNKLTESLVKIYCESKRTHDIKGKIYGEQNLIYPRIMIQDEITDLYEEIKKECQLDLIHHFEQTALSQGTNQSVKGCLGIGGQTLSMKQQQANKNSSNTSACLFCRPSKAIDPKLKTTSSNAPIQYEPKNQL